NEMWNELSRFFVYQREKTLMLFHRRDENLFRHLEIGFLERADDGIGTFGGIDRLIQQVSVYIRREPGFHAQGRDLFFDHVAAALLIRNDPLTFKPLQIGLGISNRNPFRTP